MFRRPDSEPDPAGDRRIEGGFGLLCES